MNPSGVLARPAAVSWPQRVLLPFGYALVAGIAFVVLAMAASSTPYFGFDVPLAQGLQSVQSPLLESIAYWATWIGLPPQSSVMYGILFVLVLLTRQWWTAILTGIATLGAGQLYFMVEPLVHRPRPSADLVRVTGSINMGSFPSGHILIALAVFGFVSYAVITSGRSTLIKSIFVALVTVFLLTIAFARVYSGHHWPSDVVGGALLGSVWLATVIGVFEIGRWWLAERHR